MRRYNLEVLGISETHLMQVGQQRLSTGDLLLYFGDEEENAPHTQGVALMLSKQAQIAIIGRESHGPRIIKASFKTKKRRALQWISSNAMRHPTTTMKTLKTNSTIGCSQSSRNAKQRT
ncbi:unnamed protein product [Schistosoma margrebowiei]|uniref:Uncharacterized protein n=1 Tax=Schistosoma margrebowiei TaxID=48269 RepID=A0A183MC02_9TREM|nr:unnamed protein product [Schistosoma margrebowiei]